MGLGRRTFAPGEVLTASNVMNYLMDQSVMNFAGTAARGSAIGTAVAEGMVSYLNDTDSLEVYRTIGTAAPGWNAVAFESYVDNKFGSTGIPFRMAGGVVANSNTGLAVASGWYTTAAVTVTLPTSRFNVAPIVHASLNFDSNASSVTVYSISSTSFTFKVGRLNDYAGGQEVRWSAIQMTSGSAAG